MFDQEQLREEIYNRVKNEGVDAFRRYQLIGGDLIQRVQNTIGALIESGLITVVDKTQEESRPIKHFIDESGRRVGYAIADTQLGNLSYTLSLAGQPGGRNLGFQIQNEPALRWESFDWTLYPGEDSFERKETVHFELVNSEFQRTATLRECPEDFDAFASEVSSFLMPAVVTFRENDQRSLRSGSYE